MKAMQTAQSQKERGEISHSRSFKVVKANAIIQKARFILSAQEQRILLFLISKVKPNDTAFEEKIFDIGEFCKVCGINYNGKNYRDLKAAIKTLSDKSLWVTREDGSETLLRWISTATVDKPGGKLGIKFHEHMMPYILQLSDNFTQYELFYTLGMKSQYSVRLYELLKSYEGLLKPEWTMKLAELKKRLDAEIYTKFHDFRRKVLEIAMKEINDVSDIRVTYEPLKTGRSYTDIRFTIRRADVGERVDTVLRVNAILDDHDVGDSEIEQLPGQVSFWDLPTSAVPKSKPRAEKNIVEVEATPVEAAPPEEPAAEAADTATPRKKGLFSKLFSGFGD
jgi:plasmid replication initiation protein